MRRKTFLKSLLGTVTLTGLSCCTPEKEKSGKILKRENTIGKIAGFTLGELREQYKYDLFDDFLPFMEKYVIDHEFGGFLCNTDRDGTNITKNKSTWFEGRGIWVYSFLYNNFGHEQKYLEVSRKSVEFVMKHKPSGNSLWPGAFTREGKQIGEQADNIYGDLFLANGFAEYSKATNDEEYRILAKEILLKCVSIYDDPKYSYHVTYGPQISPMKGERVLGHWMVLLRLATQMLDTNPDPEIEKISDRCIDAIMNDHYNPAFKLINEVLTHEMTLPNNEFAQFVYTGHALETLWMLLYEAVRKKDVVLFNLAAKRFKRHLEVAWDDVYGGVFRCLDHVDKNIWKVDKVLWAQEEVLIGLLFIIEHTNAQWAKDWFTKMYTYVKDKFPLKQYGFPLWILGADRKVTFEKNATRVGNFHHPRHLMLNLLSIERMIKRNGAVSDFFSQ